MVLVATRLAFLIFGLQYKEAHTIVREGTSYHCTIRALPRYFSDMWAVMTYKGTCTDVHYVLQFPNQLLL